MQKSNRIQFTSQETLSLVPHSSENGLEAQEREQDIAGKLCIHLGISQR